MNGGKIYEKYYFDRIGCSRSVISSLLDNRDVIWMGILYQKSFPFRYLPLSNTRIYYGRWGQKEMNFYIDIFATKGFEYLLVIFALLLFIPFWLKLNKKKENNDIHYAPNIGYTMADGGTKKEDNHK
jgi:hypothetical protein